MWNPKPDRTRRYIVRQHMRTHLRRHKNFACPRPQGREPSNGGTKRCANQQATRALKAFTHPPPCLFSQLPRGRRGYDDMPASLLFLTRTFSGAITLLPPSPPSKS